MKLIAKKTFHFAVAMLIIFVGITPMFATEEMIENITESTSQNMLEDTETNDMTEEQSTQNIEDETVITPFANTENTVGNVSVSVPSYDANVGWAPTQNYEVLVTVKFGEGNQETGKKVEITLPEGMRYVEYPVLGTPTPNTPEREFTTIVKQNVVNVETPESNQYYKTYNGKIVYEFNDATTVNATIPLQVTVDEVLYYGPKVFAEGIKVVGLTDEEVYEEVVLEIKAINFGSLNYSWTNPLYPSIISGESAQMRHAYLRRSGTLYNAGYSTVYYQKVEETYYFPEEANLTLATSPTSTKTISLDNDTKIVASVTNNFYGATDHVGTTVVNFSTLGTLGTGTYSALDRSEIKLTYYDGVESTVDGPTTKMYFKATSPDDIANLTNKLVIQASKAEYSNMSDNYEIISNFRIQNDKLSNKTNQVVEYIISDEKFLATNMTFVKGNDSVTQIGYKKTGDNTLYYATGNEIVTNGKKVSITKASLGLSEDEYLTFGQLYLGEVDRNYSTNDFHGNGLLSAGTFNAFVLGRLEEGYNSSSIQIKTYAIDEYGNTDQHTIVSADNNIIRNEESARALNINSNNYKINAGNSEIISTTIAAPSDRGNGNGQIGFKNPIIYIKNIPNTSINPNSIKVLQDNIELPLNVTEVTSTTTGEKSLKIEVEAEVGRYFDGNIKNTLTLQYKLDTSLVVDGMYDTAKYLFIDFEHSEGTQGSLDINDVNGNGLTTDKLTPFKSYGISFSSNKTLIMETSIRPKGTSDIYPIYDGTDNTAVGFTAGTEAEYMVRALNNGNPELPDADTVVSALTTYVPVPKQGANFGTDIQNNEFNWNMKLLGAPNIKIIDKDGNDVTAARISDYKISYTLDNTNDYANATYLDTLTPTQFNAVTMIKVENIKGVNGSVGIAAGEEAILVFDYIVDENETTIAAAPEKLSSVNDFRPTYIYYTELNAGQGYGSRVGARLEIGQISGFVFDDKDADGIYNNADTPLAGKTVKLLKNDGTGNYLPVQVGGVDVVETTLADGTYKFSNLGNGDYRVDFNDVLSTNDYFTLKNKGFDDSLNSDVDYKGTNIGLVSNIDPTSDNSKLVTVGVVRNYTGPVATVNKTAVTVKANNAQNTGTKEVVSATVAPTIFNNLKENSGWSIGNTSIATVNNAGQISGVSAGTTVATYSATDIYGHTNSKTVNVTVLSNEIPTITTTNTTMTIEFGAVLNPLDATQMGVSIADVEDGTINLNDSKVTITSTVPVDATNKTNTLGDYTVTYSVVDADGNTASSVIDVTVEDTTAPSLSVTNTNIYIETNDVKTDSSLLALLNASATDATNSQVITIDQTNVNYALPGIYTATVTAKDGSNNTTNTTVTINVVDLIEANNFTIALGDIPSANFVTLANALGWELNTDITTKTSSVVNIASAKPTTVGSHNIEFKTAEGKSKIVKVLVTNEIPVNNEVVLANNFTVKLADVATANFVTLANAKGYDITNINNPIEILVTLVSAKPTTVGMHTARFETANGGNAEIKVLVTNENPVNNEVVVASNFTVKLADVATANFVALANAKGYDVTDTENPIEILVTLISTKPTTIGLHTVRFETANGGNAEVKVLVTNEAPVNNEVVTASNFTIHLAGVASADFVALANAKGYDVSDVTNPIAIPVTLISTKPTTVGTHTVRFETANGGYAEVQVLVTNEAVVNNEVVVANGFTVKLADAATADFVTLANAKGYDVADTANPIEIPVVLISTKPTTVGIHAVRFETVNGGFAEVQVLVTNESAVNNEVVTASNFTVNLSGVVAADFVSLANAKGYDVTDATNPIEIPVTLMSAKPTTVGTHTVRFETVNGGFAEVQVLVTNEVAVNNETVVAHNFTVALADVVTADFVTLANAKGYDVTDATNPIEIPVMLVSTKPTTAGTHTIRFETTNGGYAEVQVLVTNETTVNNEVVTASDFTVSLSNVATADFVALANAKGYDVTDATNPIEIPVTLVSVKPTTVGTHTVRFETANVGYAEIQVLVTNEAPVNNEAVVAHNFTVALIEVATADFITLANAKGYDVTDPTNPIEIPVTLVSAKPTTIGLHTVRFETVNGGYAEVKVLVTNENPVNNEVVTANNFTIKLTEVATVDFVTLANAKGYDVTDLTNPIEIPVTLVSAKPTTVGLHTLRFETINGGYAEVQVLVYKDAPVDNKVVIADDFEVALNEVTTADLVTLANAKGYDITDMANPVAFDVDVLTQRPTTPGTYPMSFGLAGIVETTVDMNVYTEGSVNIYADDISMTWDEFQKIDADKLEQEILTRSNARAYHTATDTETKNNFSVNTDALKNITGPTVEIVSLTYMIDTSSYTNLANTQTSTETTYTKDISVTIEPNTVIDDGNTLPTTGENTGLTIFFATLTVLISLIGYIYSKRFSKNNNL